jgi:site-specific DNA recombinase
MGKAYAYLRVSGRSQVEGDGFPRQIAAIGKHAVGRYEILGIYKEEGVSGTSDETERPTWRRMIQDAASNGVRYLIVERLDRLARDLYIQERLLRECVANGLVLISVEEPDLNSEEPARVLFRQMMGMVSQFDKTQVVLKLRGARQRIKAETGRCEGEKPYGHYPDEKPIMELILRLAKEGESVSEIVRELNELGLRPRRAPQWRHFGIVKILDREGVDRRTYGPRRQKQGGTLQGLSDDRVVAERVNLA